MEWTRRPSNRPSEVMGVRQDLPVIPQPFAQRITTIYGQNGQAWLETLPAILQDLSQSWSLEIGEPFPGLTYNYVTRANGPNQEPYVVKVGIGTPEGSREALALREYAGQGAVRVIRHDESRHAMLLESIVPGTMLTDLDDEKATEIAADVLNQLWRPTQSDFPNLETWTHALEKIAAQPNPIPKELFDQAVNLKKELLADPPERLLLHGDLHHYNILHSEERGWLAIDPKGVIGERAYDIVSFLNNPRPMTDGETQRRISIFVERLNLDRERLVAWAYVQSIVSACWTIEDGEEGWEGAVEFAKRVSGSLGT